MISLMLVKQLILDADYLRQLSNYCGTYWKLLLLECIAAAAAMLIMLMKMSRKRRIKMMQPLRILLSIKWISRVNKTTLCSLMNMVLDGFI